MSPIAAIAHHAWVCGQIADKVFLSVDSVKTHLRTLFHKFRVEELAQNRKRAQLVELALRSGLVSGRGLDRPLAGCRRTSPGVAVFDT